MDYHKIIGCSNPVSVSQHQLTANGYTKIVSQNDGEVIIRNEDGELEVFAVRDSYSGWSLDTEDGRVLEFVKSSIV